MIVEFFAFVSVLVSLFVFYLYLRMRLRFSNLVVEEAKKIFDEWKKERLEEEVHFRLKELEKKIREDAIKRSSSVMMGKIVEQIAPFSVFKNYKINPKDARFLGEPIDYIVFDGLSEGNVSKIIFVEIKSGSSALNKNEKMIKDVVKNKKVEWKEINI